MNGLTRWFKPAFAATLLMVVLLGTLGWANAFTDAVYRQDHTRIQATKWIFQNIPAPFQLSLVSAGQPFTIPIEAENNLQIVRDIPFVQAFTPEQSGELTGITLPHLTAPIAQSQIQITVANDPYGEQALDQADFTGNPDPSMEVGPETHAAFHRALLEQGKKYFLIARTLNGLPAVISRAVIANESWDEGLPFPFLGYNPFGQFYRGATMEVRWYDDEKKRQMFLDTLAQADYIILPSQRGIWTTCRIQLTYPMTMAYYQALFDGRLGFDRVAAFTAPLKLGPLQVSDVGGTVAWNRTPALPLFNHSLLAAEEAFSVYDHPPVWIFKKRPDFSIVQAQNILYSVDLSKVVIQTAKTASAPPCQ